jgi:hypothetical protein
MKKRHKKMRVVCAALLVVALASLGLAGSAQAKLVEPFLRYQYCPWHNTEVAKCIYSVTTGGEVVLGSKKVPIVNPVLLQGGASEENPTTKFSKFFAPTEGKPALQPVSQPVPGGLAGFVNCKTISNFILKASCEAVFENGLTGVNSTLELARPASEIQVSENNLAGRTGVALKMPVKVHLENPLFGSNCYVGSSTSPIWWNLTTYKTNPPAPNKPIEGSSGKLEFIEEGLALRLTGTKLVDNAWAAPGVSGCGGFLVELALNPILNAASGLPSAAGKNTAILVNTIEPTSTAALEFIDEENP